MFQSFDEMDRRIGHGKKAFCYGYHFYRFSLKTVANDLNKSLVVRLVQKKMNICKKDDKLLHQKSRFLLASKGVGLSLDI